MKRRDRIILFSSMAFIIVILSAFLLVPKLTNKNKTKIKQDSRSGDLISVTVDTPFLFSLISDLTIGSNTMVYMGEDTGNSDYSYSLYNDKGEARFEGVKKDVILFGENYLHDLDLINYDNPDKKVPKLPAGYTQRDDEVPVKNYYVNPVNAEIVLESVYNDLSKHSPVIEENYQRISRELESLFLQANKLGEDYSSPAIFFAGETYNIGWIQDLNKNIRVISLKDSKTRKLSETYEIFIAACKKYKVNKILVDRDIEPEIVGLLRKDIDNLNIIYLQQNEVYPKLSELYRSNINLIKDSLVNLN